MTNKPVSAEDLIDEAQGDTGCFCCGTANAEDCAAEAKRHLAEAIEWIIGEYEATPDREQMVNYTPVRNELRIEQRKRLAEWLGDKSL